MNDSPEFQDDVLLKFKPILAADIQFVPAHIKKIKASEIRRTINYYPFRFFSEAMQAYEHLFNNAVMYYSGTAVEIALLTKLRPIITEVRTHNPSVKIDFYWLINNSNNILGGELQELAHKVRKIRNCYVHYEYIIAYITWLNEVDWPNSVKEQKSKYKDKPEIIKAIESLSDQADEDSADLFKIRFSFLENKQEVMDFIESRYNNYINWYSGFWEVKKNVMNFDEFNMIYHIETYDALSCLEWSYKILNKLNCLEL